jgi:hypothetical protein
MNMNIQSLIQTVSTCIRRIGHRPCPLPTPQQLDLGLDRPTDTGLSLRDALPVRSAEHWLQLGQPEEALKELHTVSASALCHPWPQRVQIHAVHAANALAA